MDKHGFDKKFWHEKNSLRFIDYIETLPNYEGFKENLNLTYAVRDGIVCHCGEVNENSLKPRNDFIDLNLIWDVLLGGVVGLIAGIVAVNKK